MALAKLIGGSFRNRALDLELNDGDIVNVTDSFVNADWDAMDKGGLDRVLVGVKVLTEITERQYALRQTAGVDE